MKSKDIRRKYLRFGKREKSWYPLTQTGSPGKDQVSGKETISLVWDELTLTKGQDTHVEISC